MSAPRLTSAMLVAALIRRVQAAGGFAAVLHRGDEHAGGIIVECAERGARQLLLERASDAEGRDGWRSTGADDESTHAAMIARRRARDPDLWVIELDIAQAERFAAETIAAG